MGKRRKKERVPCIRETKRSTLRKPICFRRSKRRRVKPHEGSCASRSSFARAFSLDKGVALARWFNARFPSERRVRLIGRRVRNLVCKPMRPRLALRVGIKRLRRQFPDYISDSFFFKGRQRFFYNMRTSQITLFNKFTAFK